MKILVTGSAGFVGAKIANRYADLGHEVFGVDNYSTNKIHEIDKRVKVYPLDIRDRHMMTDVMRVVEPDLVSHHAAQIDPRVSVAEPVNDTKINYIGTINVVDAAMEFGCEKFVFASSCAVYGDIGVTNQMIEGQFEMPNCPYGISKLASEKYLRNAVRRGAQVVVLRYPNIYGPTQSGTRGTGVMAIFAHLMARGEPVTIYGDGMAQYQYCHVDDIVEANLLAEKHIENPNNRFLLVNLAAPSVSVNDVANLLRQHFDEYDKCPIFAKPREGEQFAITMSGAAAKSQLDWTPKIDIRKGIADVAEAAKEAYKEEVAQAAKRSS